MNRDLIKKGLRHNFVAMAKCGQRFESRPDQEGIKTKVGWEVFFIDFCLNRDLIKKGLRLNYFA
ncbi:protein of unknown function [Methylocaldum szegediense]|uniref:Transposase n=1 Tax=Methylocaldum szegediense TaxID=73780 RepID=A0ABN8X3W9_9GAMM|nr:protein of unknown function [Methylocaldum szegediense]